MEDLISPLTWLRVLDVFDDGCEVEERCVPVLVIQLMRLEIVFRGREKRESTEGYSGRRQRWKKKKSTLQLVGRACGPKTGWCLVGLIRSAKTLSQRGAQLKC